jgi:hypothetical protein
MDGYEVNSNVGTDMPFHHAESKAKLALKAWSRRVHIQFFLYIILREAFIHSGGINNYPSYAASAATPCMSFLNQA